MSNGEHVRMLLDASRSKDSVAWNQWRKDNPEVVPDLRGADLRHSNLGQIDLSAAELGALDVTGAVLSGAKLGGAKLVGARMSESDLSGADLKCAHLMRADLNGANLTGADLRYADLRGTNLANTTMTDALVDPDQLRRALNVPDREPGTKSSGWKARLRRESTGGQTPGKPWPAWIASAARRLSKLGPRLMKHEDLTTLGLSQPANSTRREESGGPKSANPSADKPGK